MSAALNVGVIEEKALQAPAAGLTRLGLVLAAVGIATFAWTALTGHADRAWQAYYTNFVYWLAIAQGMVVFAAIQKVAKGHWAGMLIRFAEAGVAFLPVGLVLLVGAFLGRAHLFPWIHQPRHDLGSWLTTPFVFARVAFVLLLLWWLSWRFVKRDLLPDLRQLLPRANPAQRSRWERMLQGWTTHEANDHALYKNATILIPIWALGFTVVAFDLIMSLAIHWWSTLLGAFYFMGGLLNALALLAVLAVVFRRRMGLEELLSAKQFHDLAKLVFGFTVFWAYLMWSQFLVIWYGNMPEETWFVFYRLWGVWRPVGVAVFLLVFVIPFIGLLGEKPKKNTKVLMAFALISMLGVWLERYILIVPSINGGGGPAFGIAEVGITAGFLGLFLLAYGWFARTFPMISPRLAEDTLEREAGH